MTMGTMWLVFLLLGCAAFAAFCLLLALLLCYRKPQTGQALLRTGFGKPRISFHGLAVFPGLHRVDAVDMAPRRIEVQRMRAPWLLSADGRPVAAKIVFHVLPPANEKDLIAAIRDPQGTFDGLGQRLASIEVKCQQAVHTVVEHTPFNTLYNDTEAVKRQLCQLVNDSHDQLAIDSVAIDHLAEVPESAQASDRFAPHDRKRTFVRI